MSLQLSSESRRRASEINFTETLKSICAVVPLVADKSGNNGSGRGALAAAEQPVSIVTGAGRRGRGGTGCNANHECRRLHHQHSLSLPSTAHTTTTTTTTCTSPYSSSPTSSKQQQQLQQHRHRRNLSTGSTWSSASTSSTRSVSAAYRDFRSAVTRLLEYIASQSTRRSILRVKSRSAHEPDIFVTVTLSNSDKQTAAAADDDSAFMSTTTTMTLSLAAHDDARSAHSHSCPNCGHVVKEEGGKEEEGFKAEEAQKLIEDLQEQVRLLTQKATAADKWADYEDELRSLRAQTQNQNQIPSVPPTPSDLSPPTAQISPRSATPNTTTYVPMSNRLSSFLSARKSTSNLALSSPSHPSHNNPLPPTPSERDLSKQLENERKKRQQAEGKLDEASGELEELSAQLFMQANEMVAQERKARAKLEARVEVLERRDGEKRKRLERLEGAMGRIERVRGLLGEGLP